MTGLKEIKPLHGDGGQIAFLRLEPGFRWFVSGMAIDSSGYVNDRYVTVEFVRCYPRPDLYFDTKGRNLSMGMGVGVELPRRSYYSSIKCSIHYPPTNYREGTVYTRSFVFSDYLKKGCQGYTVYMGVVGVETYQWESNRGGVEMVVEEEVLGRDLRVWLGSV
jgi:hypothetical protein